MKKCVVILSQKRQDSEFYKRFEKGIEVFYNKKCNYIALLSESANEKNLKLLNDAGINDENILTEKTSKDTIGEAFFVKKNIVLPYNIKSVFVVSSDYHLRYRAKIIFDYIFESQISVSYVEVKTKKIKNREIITDQLRSLKYFDNLITKKKNEISLIDHPLYKGMV